MVIADVHPGCRFEAGEEAPFYRGTLVRVGEHSAVVRYDVDREKTTDITVRRGREVTKQVSFTTPTRPVAISLNTTVRLIDEEQCNAIKLQDGPACAGVPDDVPSPA